jgi:hypothetical protein
VGSPRPRVATPAVVVPSPVVAATVVEASKDPGPTYADQMARAKSKIFSDQAPPKPAGVTSPAKSPLKVAIPPAASVDGSRCALLVLVLMIVTGPLPNLVQGHKL